MDEMDELAKTAGIAELGVLDDKMDLVIRMILETSVDSPKQARMYLQTWESIREDLSVSDLLWARARRYSRKWLGEIETAGLVPDKQRRARRQLIQLVFVSVFLSLALNIAANFLYDYFVRLHH
jgi:hypothetical protein